MTDEYPVVSSLETSDGGKAGIVSEVPRAIAAKMIVEGRAVIATEAERERYRQEQQDGKARAEKAELARRVQVALIADPVASHPLANHGSNRKVSGSLEK